MEIWLTKIVAGIVALVAPLLTLFDLPGNTTMVLTAAGLAYFFQDLYFQEKLLLAMAVVYVIGEAWEFLVSLLGIKKEKLSWFAVFLIGIGGFVGTVVGTAALPILGSFLGGLAGAFLAAFLYEYSRSRASQDALNLAWKAAKIRCLALLGKVVAAMVLAVLLIKLVIL